MIEQSTRDWLLKIAQEVEDDPTRWTQGEEARDAGGLAALPWDGTACCWCAVGFINRSCEYREPYLFGAIGALRTACNRPLLSRHNDDLKSAAEFVAWFRRAAELCT